MLRSFLIYFSKARWARQAVTRWPIAWRAASRFVAGESLQDAIQTVRRLNEKGIHATLDRLGEHVYTKEEARWATDEVLKIFDGIEQTGIKANVSIKLTQIGLALDEAMCAENLQRILAYAAERGNFVRIDMEDSPWVDTTLELYCRMRDEFGLINSGVVFQAYLYRTETDLRRVVDSGGKVRLCKGAYMEPPEVAFPKKSDVDANYDHLAQLLIEGAIAAGSPPASPDGRFPPIPAIASHDPRRLVAAKEYAAQAGLPKRAIEFQMLYGIRRDLQETTAREGYPVRVYVPFGTEWYPYFMRRLAERPANLWFFLSNLLRK